MTIQHAHTRRGLLRSLTVVCLLAGVLAMHGLTGSHDAAMAMTHQMPAASAAHAPAAALAPMVGQQEPAAPAAAHSMSASRSQADAPSANFSPAPPDRRVSVEPDGAGHLHAMGDVCLAMLAALLLALIVALARRSFAAAHPVPVAGTAVVVASNGLPPPWCQPTLSKLCILRT
jgi:hypothetical protein